LYNYKSTTIQGFGVSHEPSPWIGDHGTIQIMPMTGSLRTSPDLRKSTFSHAKETARAHYYSVQLDTYNIKTEISPTDHASAWRFTFPSANNAYILFDSIDSVHGSITVDKASRTISGYTDHNGPRFYFYAKFDKAISSFGYPPNTGVAGWIQFATTTNEVVNMKMGTSFISVAQAKDNMDQEVGSKTFDQIKEEAATIWDNTLGKIEIEGATEDQKAIFYSNLYRAFMYPNSMWENVGGVAKYFSPYNNTLRNGKTYVNNGFWDTFRATWPLYSLLIPTKTGEMLDGFVNAYKDGGWTPRWTGPGYIDIMVGSHADIVFADAFLKGITNFDYNTAYESMLKNAMTFSGDGSKGRKGNGRSIFMGYIPTDTLPESAAWYLEDVVNDFGIAQMAKGLGKTDEYKYFLNRSMNYTNLFSPSVGFFRGKKLNGSWRTSDADFHANEWGYEFTEGAPWHYSTAASNDPQGMANLYGGRSGLSAKIDSVFAASRDYRIGSYGQVIHEMLEAYDTNMGQYAHANEPIHHMIYMYNYAGTPWKTQEHVRDAMDLYDTGIGNGGGYLGDEDNGQMSAWYVFSAMGFYPASPGHPEYAIGSPLFKKVTIHLENGQQFVINAPNNSSGSKYIQNATLNGAAHTKNYFRHSDIVAGGVLDLDMGASPSTWGGEPDDVPTSVTTNARSPVPMADKADGGTITASSENSAKGEGTAQAFDNNSLTKWLAFEPRPSIEYQFPGGKAYTVSGYTLTSANDFPGRDPKDWVLKGSSDGSNWVTLDTRDSEDFVWRQYTKVYSVNNVTPYPYYRFEFTANHGEPYMQLAEIELIGDAPIAAVSATADSTCAAKEDAWKAADGSSASKWCSLGKNKWLQIDLGADHHVNQFVVKHASAGGESAAWNTKDFNIEISTNNVDWTNVVEATNNSDGVTQHTIPSTLARYVRLNVVTPTQDGDTSARIYEVEVYGRPVSGVWNGSFAPGAGDDPLGEESGGALAGVDEAEASGLACAAGGVPGGAPAFSGCAAVLALLGLGRRRSRARRGRSSGRA
jgi:predicted alpha-1,2-mannosidase